METSDGSISLSIYKTFLFLSYMGYETEQIFGDATTLEDSIRHQILV